MLATRSADACFWQMSPGTAASLYSVSRVCPDLLHRQAAWTRPLSKPRRASRDAHACDARAVAGVGCAGKRWPSYTSDGGQMFGTYDNPNVTRPSCYSRSQPPRLVRGRTCPLPHRHTGVWELHSSPRHQVVVMPRHNADKTFGLSPPTNSRSSWPTCWSGHRHAPTT